MWVSLSPDASPSGRGCAKFAALKGKTVCSAEAKYVSVDYKFRLVFTDGSVVEWSYERGEGNTMVNGEQVDGEVRFS
jgi:hypothetical protein